MNPKELLFAHRYAEAVEAHRTHLLQYPEQNYYPGLGQALLGLKRYSEAVSAFGKATEIESQRLKGSQPFLNQMATALWLAGKRANGLLQWHRAVAGVLDGSINYGDSSGGGTQGLLLWYGAITLGDAVERDCALEYLGSIAKRKAHAISWPRPVVLMVLGRVSFVDALDIAAGSSTLSKSLENAQKDLLKRRRLCQVLFYAACLNRQVGDQGECSQKMRLCSELENPILESEWYLARGEFELVHAGKLNAEAASQQ